MGGGRLSLAREPRWGGPYQLSLGAAGADGLDQRRAPPGAHRGPQPGKEDIFDDSSCTFSVSLCFQPQEVLGGRVGQPETRLVPLQEPLAGEMRPVGHSFLSTCVNPQHSCSVIIPTLQMKLSSERPGSLSKVSP